MSTVVQLLYLLSAILFVLGLKGLTRVRSARRGNATSALGMLVAIAATLIALGGVDYRWIAGGFILGGLIGLIAAQRVAMTSMPEMVALFNGFGGAASALVGLSTLWLAVIEPGTGILTTAAAMGTTAAVTLVLSVVIGAVTFTGSLVAFLKLNGTIGGAPILLPGRHLINAVLLLGSLGLGAFLVWEVAATSEIAIFALVVLGAALLLGWLLVIPIGGADMPVVISLLNSYSGVAAAATGFVIDNSVLIVSGALVGASGLILTQIMCVAMNRSLANVLFGGFGAEDSAGGPTGTQEYTNVRSCGPEEAALVLESAESVVFVPGYGLAVAQAQHVTREVASLLEKRGATVSYAIHPVAGRMPGHMNVLLAEADVPYEQLLEMERINPEFKNTDVVVVVGANDVVNPAAQTTPGSPIYGMPILEVYRAKTVFIIKRSLGAGFAGVKNELFEYPNAMMIYGDAKKILQSLLQELKGSG